MQNMYLLKFNNYINKIFKKLETISDYVNYQVGSALTGVNFVPGNGLATAHVCNSWNASKPDYLVVTTTDNTAIESRWFVIDADRLKNGQYRLTLKRDVLADYTEEFLQATSLISKATLLDTDPLIFNDEAIKVNQILTSETPLKDETGVPWIVAYVPKHDASDPDIAGWEDKTVSGLSVLPEANFTANSEAEFKTLLQDGKKILSAYVGHVDIQEVGEQGTSYKRVTVRRTENTSSYSTATKSLNSYFQLNSIPTTYGPQMIEGFDTGIKLQYGLTYTEQTYSDLIEEYNGKTVKINNQVYAISISSSLVENEVESYLDHTNQVYINTRYELGFPGHVGSNDAIVYLDQYNYRQIQVTLTQIFGVASTFNISKVRRSLRDQPYDMLVLPYKDTEGNIAKITYNNNTFTYDPDAMLNIATHMSTTYGSSVVYDVQILPYCPIRDLMASDGSIVIDTTMINAKYSPIVDSQDVNNYVGFVFYAYESSATFNIAHTISVTNPKLEHITKLFRLASPNFDGEYEFDPYMNGGVEYFNVDFTYLPYQPWIKINPNYKYLYGKDLNDSRGLILGGNFSITKMDDAWANYQLQNVNYQNIFDRQIKNMKFNNKLQMIEQGIGSASQALGTGVGVGAFTNPVAGAVTGTLSVIAGGIDLGITRSRQKEALSYSRDMFNMNLQNVQALPQTISKVTAFNINSKYFPFLKEYNTTPEEEQAVIDKLRWDGMTVGRIGVIDDYIRDEETYIQASIIRIDIEDDYNIAQEISNELSRGVYIKRSDIV